MAYSRRVPDLDTFSWQKPILGFLNNPGTVSPTKGARYMVGSSPASGSDFENHGGEFAWYDGSEWQFVTPTSGWMTYNIATGEYLRFDGSNWFSDDEVGTLLFVDVSRQDTYEESGAQSRPFKTIAAAVTEASNMGVAVTIKIAPGTYNESSIATLPAYVSLSGGGVGNTIINGNIVTGSKHCTISDLQITGILTINGDSAIQNVSVGGDVIFGTDGDENIDIFNTSITSGSVTTNCATLVALNCEFTAADTTSLYHVAGTAEFTSCKFNNSSASPTIVSDGGSFSMISGFILNGGTGDAADLQNGASLDQPNVLSVVFHSGGITCGDAHTYVMGVFDRSNPEEPTQNDPTGTNLHFQGASQIMVDASQFSVQIPTDEDMTLQSLLVWMDANFGGPGPIGTPTDGTYDDGLFEWTEDSKVNDCMDDLNEALSELAPPSPSSLAGTDLVTNTSLSFKTGIVPTGLSEAWDEANSGSTISNVITVSTVDLKTYENGNVDPNTPGDYFGPGNEGFLKALVDGSVVATLDIDANFNDPGGPKDRPETQTIADWDSTGDGDSCTDGQVTYTSGTGFLQVLECGKYNEFSLWQRMVAEMKSQELDAGYHKFQMNHVYREADRLTNEYEVFYDDNTDAIAWVSSPILTEGTKSNAKFISGVEYYGRNSTVVVAAEAENMYKNIYHSSAVCRYTVDGNSTTQTSNPASTPAVEDTFVLNSTVSLSRSNYQDVDIRSSVTIQHPHKSSLTATTPILGTGMLFTSYGNVSTQKLEYFRDENYRLPLTWDVESSDSSAVAGGQWDNEAQLVDGNALVYNSTLKHASSEDLSGKRPTQTNNCNFTGFTENAVYLRAFYDSSPHSSVTLTIPNVTVAQLGEVGSGDINIEVKLPGVDGEGEWRDAGRAFGDGNGCQNTGSSSGNSLAITFGEDSTANSGYLIYVRITFLNTTRTMNAGLAVDW